MDSTSSAFFEYWNERVRRDLLPFADPGTTLDSSRESARRLTVRWKQDDQQREANFNFSIDKGVSVDFGGQRQPYREFFARSDMSDTLGLAKTILRLRKQRVFVDTLALEHDNPGAVATPAVALLQSIIEQSTAADATTVAVVTGDAGAGKTSVLQALVDIGAEQYVAGRSPRLLLYVNAQGRALSRFNEALASELDDLRAKPTYHAIATLVRVGLIVPVIDGFDELLGMSGYDEAFGSLSSFVEELNGEGCLIASARSAYYEQEFLSRANRSSGLGAQAWRQIAIRILDWGEGQVSQFVRQLAAARNADAVNLEKRVRNLFVGSNAGLIRKPLFVARAADLLMSAPNIEQGDDFLDTLVAAYLERERTEKLLSKSGAPLLGIEELEALLVELAGEMWNQETRVLDNRSTREIAEFVLLSSGIPESTQRIVIERMPTAAFLAVAKPRDSITFEHETFFSYFLARRIADEIGEGGPRLTMSLSRSVLPSDVAEFTTRRLNTALPDEVRTLVAKLGAAAKSHSSRQQQVRENAGTIVSTVLVAACTGGRSLENLRIENLVIPGGTWHGVEIRITRFENVDFRRVDLTSTRLIACSAHNSTFVEALIEPSITRLELDGLDPANSIVGVRVRVDGVETTLYEPREIHRLLAKIGAAPAEPEPAAVYRNVQTEILRAIEKLVRVFGRSNPVCTSDDLLSHVFSSSFWPQVERHLLEAGVVTAETRSARGPTKTFLRRQVSMDELMQGLRRDADVQAPVSRFWDSIEADFPAKTKSKTV